MPIILTISEKYLKAIANHAAIVVVFISEEAHHHLARLVDAVHTANGRELLVIVAAVGILIVVAHDTAEMAASGTHRVGVVAVDRFAVTTDTTGIKAVTAIHDASIVAVANSVEGVAFGHDAAHPVVGGTVAGFGCHHAGVKTALCRGVLATDTAEIGAVGLTDDVSHIGGIEHMSPLANDAGSTIITDNRGIVDTPDNRVVAQGNTRDASGTVMQCTLLVRRTDNRTTGSGAALDFTVVHRAAHRTRV